MTWNWYNDIKKQERDMEVGSTNYAKDLGDKVEFGGYSDKSNNVTIPKAMLGAALDKYEKDTGNKVPTLQNITQSAGPTTDFVYWARENKQFLA